MRIVILTQEDNFFLPLNVLKLIDIAEVIEVDIVDAKGTLSNKTVDFIRWFGIFQVSKMALKVIGKKAQSIIDMSFKYKIWEGVNSVKDVCRKNKIPFEIVSKINCEEYINKIKKLAPDLIVSFSCPIVIKEPLLSLPKFGIINVHGSFLPYYRGLLPSFWVLYKNEKETGASVHYMSDKIDDGDILVQSKVNIEDCHSMFEVMNRTKKLGGELILKAVQNIQSGTVTTIKNEPLKGSYFTWPAIEEARDFIKKGGKLV
jgi:methionyl-tRNA formyltransferase